MVTTNASLLIQADVILYDPGRVERFVGYLHTVVANVNCSTDRMLRMYACEALRELETWYERELLDGPHAEDVRVRSAAGAGDLVRT